MNVSPQFGKAFLLVDDSTQSTLHHRHLAQQAVEKYQAKHPGVPVALYEKKPAGGTMLPGLPRYYLLSDESARDFGQLMATPVNNQAEAPVTVSQKQNGTFVDNLLTGIGSAVSKEFQTRRTIKQGLRKILKDATPLNVRAELDVKEPPLRPGIDFYPSPEWATQDRLTPILNKIKGYIVAASYKVGIPQTAAKVSAKAQAIRTKAKATASTIGNALNPAPLYEGAKAGLVSLGERIGIKRKKPAQADVKPQADIQPPQTAETKPQTESPAEPKSQAETQPPVQAEQAATTGQPVQAQEAPPAQEKAPQFEPRVSP